MFASPRHPARQKSARPIARQDRNRLVRNCPLVPLLKLNTPSRCESALRLLPQPSWPFVLSFATPFRPVWLAVFRRVTVHSGSHDCHVFGLPCVSYVGTWLMGSPTGPRDSHDQSLCPLVFNVHFLFRPFHANLLDLIFSVALIHFALYIHTSPHELIIDALGRKSTLSCLRTFYHSRSA